MNQPAVPDLLAVDVPLGGRVLVVSDLHLGPVTTAASAAATVELAQAIDAWAGPGLIIFNGSCLELLCAGGADARAALAAHPALLMAVKAFAAGAGRRVLYLPGARDSRLAWDLKAAAALRDMLGAEVALAAELAIDTGTGPRLVRVEPGHQLDALTFLSDPRNPAESPLGHHLVCEVLPALGESFPGGGGRRGSGSRSGGSGPGESGPAGSGPGESGPSGSGPSGSMSGGSGPRSGSGPGGSGPRSGSGPGGSGPGGSGPRSGSGSEDGWLSGLDSLDDPASFPRFLASRLTYRRLGRHAWVLLLPVVAAVLLRLPFAAVRQAHQHVASASRIAVFLALATVIGLVLIGTVVALLVRGTWRGLAGVALRRASDDDRQDRNAAARARARELVTNGHAGLITGNTRRPELTYLGRGFYANGGCATKVVSESPARLDSLGVPSLFLAHRQIAWIELEAGGELHVRLLHARKDLAGATMLERLLTRRSPEKTPGGDDIHPVLVATFPHGMSWPAPVSVDRRLRRFRRVSAALVAAAGVLSLMSAFLAPARQRLSSLLQFVPLAVPQAAAALVALASLGLLALARSIRRGQRRAWLIAEALLAGTFLLHLLKGFDIEEAVATALVGGYLFVHRDAFRAGVDKPSTRRGLLTLVWGAALSIVAGTAAVELGTRLSGSRHHQRMPMPRAFLAATERLLGLRTVKLPDRLDDFFAPAMVAVAIGIGLAVAYLLSRPVVARHTSYGSAGSDLGWVGGAGAGGGCFGSGAGGAGSRAGGALGAGGLIQAREVVRRYGSGTLDYFALRPDKEFFFWGSSVVAYGVYGGVCLVSPDPIGPRAEREEVWKAFRRFADNSGWTLTVLGAGEDWLPVYRAAGMHDLYVGDEAVVDCTRFTMDGGRFKGLRQAVNRVAKYGYTITFHDPSTIDPALRAQLEAVMTKSRRGDFERGFSMTLGRAFDASDDGLLLAVVWGPPPATPEASGADAESAEAGRTAATGPAATLALGAAAEPVAFCQYVPAPGINGYSLDLMRRDNGEHPNGLLDFAIVETIRYLKAQGKTGLGLNFATMRAVLAGEAGDGLSQRVQAWLLRRMSDSMQIESLWKFNAKFDPDWLPRYALYDSPEHALPCAIAVARAESFWELPVIGRFLVPSTPATNGTPAPVAPATSSPALVTTVSAPTQAQPATASPSTPKKPVGNGAKAAQREPAGHAATTSAATSATARSSAGGAHHVPGVLAEPAPTNPDFQTNPDSTPPVDNAVGRQE